MNTARLLALLLAFLPLTSVQAQTDLRVAVIDLQKVFQEYYKTKEADESLKGKMNQYRKERDDRMEDYRKLVDQIKGLRDAASDPSLSEEARKDKQTKLQEKVNEARTREREIREFEQTTTNLFRDESQRMRKKIVDEINLAIAEFCKGKYSLVMDASGLTMNGTPALLYSEGLTNITADITAKINKK